MGGGAAAGGSGGGCRQLRRPAPVTSAVAAGHDLSSASTSRQSAGSSSSNGSSPARRWAPERVQRSAVRLALQVNEEMWHQRLGGELLAGGAVVACSASAGRAGGWVLTARLGTRLVCGSGRLAGAARPCCRHDEQLS